MAGLADFFRYNVQAQRPDASGKEKKNWSQVRTFWLIIALHAFFPIIQFGGCEKSYFFHGVGSWNNHLLFLPLKKSHPKYVILLLTLEQHSIDNSTENHSRFWVLSVATLLILKSNKNYVILFDVDFQFEEGFCGWRARDWRCHLYRRLHHKRTQSGYLSLRQISKQHGQIYNIFQIGIILIFKI